MTIVLTLLVLLCGSILAITPSLMPATECFAVSVPPSVQNHPRIRAYRRTYTTVTLAFSCVGAVALGAFVALHGVGPQDERLFAAVVCVATFVPLLVGFGLMLYFRSRVSELKGQEDWSATSQRAVAVVVDADVPQPISLVWNLLYLLIVAVLAAFTLAHYDRFPERIPMQTSFDGTVTRWADKSLASVLFPTCLVAFMGLIFTFAHWGVLHSKRPINPAAPASSALAYGLFARTQSLVLLIGGVGLSAGMGTLICLSMLGSLSMSSAAIAVCALATVFAGAELWVAVAQGQSGARIARELCEGDELARDDDTHWLLGTIYVNREDPSIFVPKRFGIGWTANLANPLTWLCFALIAVVTLAFAWASTVLVG